MDVVCGGATPNEVAYSNDSAASINSSCAGGRMASCSSGSDVAGKYVITNSCALFDFAAYTVVMGSLTALGLVGNIVSFVVLLRDRGRSATSFLLQALAVADTMVLVAAVPLYICSTDLPVHRSTGRVLLAVLVDNARPVADVLHPVHVHRSRHRPRLDAPLLRRLQADRRPLRPHRRLVVGCRRRRTRSESSRRRFGLGSVQSFDRSPGAVPRRRPGCFLRHLQHPAILRVRERSGLQQRRRKRDPLRVQTVVVRRRSPSIESSYSNVLYFVVIHGGPLLLIGFLQRQTDNGAEETPASMGGDG